MTTEKSDHNQLNDVEQPLRGGVNCLIVFADSIMGEFNLKHDTCRLASVSSLFVFNSLVIECFSDGQVSILTFTVATYWY